MKRFFALFCVFGFSGVALNAFLKTKSRTSVSRAPVSRTLSRPLSKIAAASTPSSGITMGSGATVNGATLSNLNLGTVGALSNLSSRTTGNTAISLDGSAFTPGATIAVGSNNAVQGAQQVTSSVLGGSNTAMVSGYSSSAASVANSAASSLRGGTSSGVSNILNETTADFVFNMNGSDLGGGVGSLTLQNGSTVIGGLTTTGIVGGSTNGSSILRQPVSFVQPG